MAFPKSELFPIMDQQVSIFNRALGYPARISILLLLEEKGPMQVTDLVKILPLTAGTISEHLKKLRQVGLVSAEVHGLRNYYAFSKSGFRDMLELQQTLVDKLRVDEEVAFTQEMMQSNCDVLE
ncbi:MAG TPA: metalloregulator ArsR/SmtB family transcription factor [Saprospiraceae bacterium]|nr:metalloregulator ArsR/SmtB family transcription factor [Saprospiraceae bacterium]